MTDADWRRLQRAWEANPGDQSALMALLTARRRAGEPLTRELLEARRFPGRTVRCALPFFVTVSARPGVQTSLSPVDGAVELPPHKGWTLVFPGPLPHEGALGALLFALEGEAVMGMQLKGPGLTDAGVTELAGTTLPGLEGLRLQAGELGATGIEALAGLPDLLQLELIECGNVDDDALASLGDLRGLVRLELGQLAVDGSGLAALAKSGLEELEVWGCALAEEGIAAIAGIGSLRDLRLRGRLVEDEDVVRLTSGLPELRRLHLGETPGLTNAGLSACARLTKLEHLWLGQTPNADDEGVVALAALPLKSLHIMVDPMGDAALRALAEGTPTLEELSLWGSRIGDAGLHDIARLTRLRELSLAFLPDAAGDDGFAALSALTNLVELDLFGCTGLTAQGLQFLRELPALRQLSVSHTDALHDDGPQALTGLPLRRLTLSSVEGLHDDALLPLATLAELEVLRVVSCSTVEGRWLSVLNRLPKLRDLDLSFCPHLDAAELVHLDHVPRLGALDLTGAESLDDAGLAVLPRLTELEDLSLDGCLGLTDRGLEHLAGCSELKILSLDGCSGLSDEGLRHLRGLSKLRLLFLGGGGITRMGVEVLRRALPGCDVVSTLDP